MVKSDLAQLQEEDPEFYQFLLENDKELLDSDHSDNSEQSDGVDQSSAILNFESTSLDNWRQNTKTLRRCFDDGDFNLNSPMDFENLIKFVFGQSNKLCEILGLHGEYKKYSKEVSYTKYKSVVKNTVICYINFLETQACDVVVNESDVCENPLMALVLSSTSHIVQLAFIFPKLFSKLISVGAIIFGNARTSVTKAKGIAVIKLCINAKLGRNIHDYQNNVDCQNLEFAIKILYKTFLKHSSQVYEKNLSLIEFMRQSIVNEFCGINKQVTFQVAFQYLRQIANVVRLAYDEKSEKKIHQVYGWVSLQALKFWSIVICRHASKFASEDCIAIFNEKIMKNAKISNQINLLVYPFVQLSHAILQLQPIPKFISYRLHLVECLIEVSKSTDELIPIFGYFLQILQSNLFLGNPKRTTLKPLNLSVSVRISKNYLNTIVLQTIIMEKVHDLLVRSISVHSGKIYFPDWSAPVLKILKSVFAKSTQKKTKLLLRELIKKIEESSGYVSKHRVSIKFGPLDLELIEHWENSLPAKSSITKLADSIEKISSRTFDYPPPSKKDESVEEPGDSVEKLIVSNSKKRVGSQHTVKPKKKFKPNKQS
eukprot:NODE_521_length_6537_cov_0.627058.p2 type:complete len:598 gc:universal NODE_521_length_6537_cov_0.627058:2895-1102(-)